jgi:hypothetical protein
LPSPPSRGDAIERAENHASRQNMNGDHLTAIPNV